MRRDATRGSATPTAPIHAPISCHLSYVREDCVIYNREAAAACPPPPPLPHTLLRHYSGHMLRFFSLSLQAAFNEIKDNFKLLTPRCCCQHNAACYPALPPLSLSLRCSTIGHGAWRITLSAALIKSISNPPSRVLHAAGPSALCLHHPVEHTTGKKTSTST